MRVDATIRRCVFVFCCVPLEPAFQHCELVTRRTLPRGAVIISIRGSSTISVWLFLDVLLRASGNANFFGVFFCVFLFFLVFFGCVFVPFFFGAVTAAATGRCRTTAPGTGWPCAIERRCASAAGSAPRTGTRAASPAEKKENKN